jgi:hypothetical protein
VVVVREQAVNAREARNTLRLGFLGGGGCRAGGGMGVVRVEGGVFAVEGPKAPSHVARYASWEGGCGHRQIENTARRQHVSSV